MSYHSKRKAKKAARGSRGKTKRTRSPRVTFHAPKEHVDELGRFARMRHEPVSNLIREAIADWLAAAGASDPFAAAPAPEAASV